MNVRLITIFLRRTRQRTDHLRTFGNRENWHSKVRLARQSRLVEAHEVHPRLWHQGGQSRNNIQRREHDLGGAVTW